jgi:radical SAM-linked protein
VQRLRLRFFRGEELKYISHLDLMRFWERALRRAHIPISYSEGFAPHPRISLAAPLPIGTTSEAELMDIFLRRLAPPQFLMQCLDPQLPYGVKLLEAFQIPFSSPSLQSQVRFAEYRVTARSDRSMADVQKAVAALLESPELPWHHLRDTGPRYYDLRSLVGHIWLVEYNNQTFTLGMRLRCDPTGTGRPEQVAAALGIADEPKSIHRTRLILAE